MSTLWHPKGRKALRWKDATVLLGVSHKHKMSIFLFFKKKLVSARQKSKPLASCKGNNFGISSLLSKQVIIKVPIEKWVWMFQNQFIFTFTPTEENAWFAFQPGSGWGGIFTNACKPAWTTYPRKRTKFSGLLSLVKEISTVGCVCDFFLMRKAIAPYKKTCALISFPPIPGTLGSHGRSFCRCSALWPVKIQAEDMPKYPCQPWLELPGHLQTAAPVVCKPITKGRFGNGDSIQKTNLSSRRLV